MSDAECVELGSEWLVRARLAQLPPTLPWTTWLVIGGRGSGKTRTGAEWVNGLVRGLAPFADRPLRRIALIGETIGDVREVMIDGPSGLRAVARGDVPVFEASRRRLVWDNGAVAQVFSAQEPDSLRGPQFEAAWCDEAGKWPNAEEVWNMLQFALRLGEDPRVCVTTTPRNVGVLKALLAASSTVATHAPTEANRANLAASFLAEVRARYAGTRLGRQELDGILLADAEGALWSGAMLEAARVASVPALDRVVVAVDPSVSGGAGADACGIVVAGAQVQGPPQDWRAYVLADRTVQGVGPLGWARAAVAAMEEFGADRLVAEVNQGGQLVEEVLRQADPMVPYRSVRAARGKVARAEPVAALYEQGRVRHGAGLADLEDQMCLMTAHGFEGRGSPDRVDALVWALHELMIAPAARWRRPRVRVL